MKRFTADVYQIQNVYLKHASKSYKNIICTKLIYQIIAAQNWESSYDRHRDIHSFLVFQGEGIISRMEKQNINHININQSYNMPKMHDLRSIFFLYAILSDVPVESKIRDFPRRLARLGTGFSNYKCWKYKSWDICTYTYLGQSGHI